LAPVATAVAAVALALVLIVTGFRPSLGPGQIHTPQPSPSPTEGLRTPEALLLAGTIRAERLPLGTDVAPIDVVGAFGSIWTANIHADDIRRFDPDTMAELDRIDVDSAAWFAVTDDALWVTSQTGTGLSRIDPGSGSVAAHVGDDPPCLAPVVALGSIWQSACDGNVFLRVDPGTSKLLATIPALDHRWLVSASDLLVTLGPEGLAILDPATGSFAPIPGSSAANAGQLLGSDGEMVWVLEASGVSRLDPTDGALVGQFPYQAAKAVTFANGHAWLSVESVGVVEIDLATNAVLRTIPLASPDIAREVDGVLWVTDFESSELWRIEP
jgi:streptogramin lyase